MIQLRTFSVSLVSLALAAACGGKVESSATSTTTGTGGSSTTGAGGSSTTGTGGSGGSQAVECSGSAPFFPTFDKSCASASDCAIAFHQINCCGSRAAIGITKTAVPAFNEAEATCESQYPGCGCAQGPTTTEDGKAGFDESAIQVACKQGACSTFVP